MQKGKMPKGVTMKMIAEHLGIPLISVRRKLVDHHYYNGEFIKDPDTVKKHIAELEKKHGTTIDNILIDNRDIGAPSIPLFDDEGKLKEHFHYAIINRAWKQKARAGSDIPGIDFDKYKKQVD